MFLNRVSSDWDLDRFQDGRFLIKDGHVKVIGHGGFVIGDIDGFDVLLAELKLRAAGRRNQTFEIAIATTRACAFRKVPGIHID